MLKNYFKIAIAVLRRKKFFTFISLFGISFTLTILMVLTAFVDQLLGNNYPDKKRDRSLYVTGMEETSLKTGSINGGQLSFYFLSHYGSTLKTPIAIAISSRFSGTNTYVNNKKLSIDYKYTNAAYWDVLDYIFLEGHPYTARQVANGEHVAVISEKLKEDYFGEIPSVLGKYIEADNESYRVIGVVTNIPITTYLMYSQMYLPYTVSKQDVMENKGYMGKYSAILLGATTADVPKMKAEYDGLIRRLPMEQTEAKFDHIFSHAVSYFEGYVSTGNEKLSGVTLLLTSISIFVFLLMLLPTINLININLTRIMERSSEIGIRKAFGASSKTLVVQFLVENMILTLIGGLIGIALSCGALAVLNHAQLIPNLDLTMNITVLLYALLACLFFGVLSGVYPAWRMSRMNVVTALKAN